ncbi:MAG: transcription-repair coupling factor [Acidimicrobiales bacterium]
MLLTALPPLLRHEPALVEVLGRASATLSVPEAARALTLAGIADASSRHPFLVIAPTGADAERLAADLASFVGPDEVDLFPAWETLPFERVSPSVEAMGRRLRTMWHLSDAERAPRFVVAPVRAIIQRLGPHVTEVDPIIIGPGDQVDPTELVERLVRLGYRREYQVENRGEVAVRGSIVDVFPSTGDVPVRIDLWGDEVDRLTEFAVADQRSTVERAEVEIFGCRELLPTEDVQARAASLMKTEAWGREQWERLAAGELFDGMESWLPWLANDHADLGSGETILTDLLPPTAQIVLIEPRRIRDRAGDVAAEEADLAGALAKAWGVEEGRELPRLHVGFDRLLTRTEAPAWSVTTVPESPDVATVLAAGWHPVAGDGAPLVRQLTELLNDGYRVVVGADTTGSANRVRDLLSSVGLHFAADHDPTKPGGAVVVAPLSAGTILPRIKLAVLSESDVTGRRRAHRRARPRTKRQSQGFFDDLKPGDYVVHHHHGVGRYGGMVTRAIGGTERDYLLVEYKGGDKLYVPSDQIDTVRHYTGGDSPSLHRLGGTDFARTKAKVRSAVAEIAQELVVLYQKRVHTTGHSFPVDTPWQKELEDAFPYALTPDQARTVDEVKSDMESTHPMDRLVCGDVGFGKTEIALRAAFKAIQDGKQVAVLVPTTLLATQHFQTFSDRFAGYPIRVEVLSRFLTNAQAREVIKGIAAGEVDLVVGTHRLLSEDVQFRNLGLLVVDEEQRFGVNHKESMKKLRTNVDVLTLTATPIPRTLEMSLVGIRDLSVLHTPPADRQPILTYVGEYDDRAVAEAIRRELLREGQVFYVHNRVQDIEQHADRLRELVPEARIATAHGQMDEGSLEKVVFDFWEGRYDVLVCTTIIESGIDMPTVNTLVVDRADLMGLGQLHQLRGRVGRAGMRAYAYLFFPQNRELSEEAYERLKTIAEATELGSGFKIAMRDLEIRGAGNLLGTGQSGHVSAVGYDLYCQMVNEAVAELNGEPVKEPAEIKIELPVDANIPPSYIAREDLRIEAYRRLASVTDPQTVEDIRTEWLDRYGPVPPPAEALLEVARLRAECHRVGLREVTVVKGTAFSGPKYVARLSPLPLKMSQTMKVQRLYKGAVVKADLAQVQLPVAKADGAAAAIVEALRTIVPPVEDPALAGAAPGGGS